MSITPLSNYNQLLPPSSLRLPFERVFVGEQDKGHPIIRVVSDPMYTDGRPEEDG
jgi:hypothetical protein